MTGFASRRGAAGRYSWTWDLRSVNGRGLDLRLRLPDWIEGLESAVRTRLQKAMHRGQRAAQSQGLFPRPGLPRPRSTPKGSPPVLRLVARTEAEAAATDLGLRPSSAAEILGLSRCLLDAPSHEEDGQRRAQKGARGRSGAAHRGFHRDARVRRARRWARRPSAGISTRSPGCTRPRRRRPPSAARGPATCCRAQIERLMEATDARGARTPRAGACPHRGEIGRHRGTRPLAAMSMPRGRFSRRGVRKAAKLDFLVQEFNPRGQNTLCSKSGSRALTAVGLDPQGRHRSDARADPERGIELVGHVGAVFSSFSRLPRGRENRR